MLRWSPDTKGATTAGGRRAGVGRVPRPHHHERPLPRLRTRQDDRSPRRALLHLHLQWRRPHRQGVRQDQLRRTQTASRVSSTGRGSRRTPTALTTRIRRGRVPRPTSRWRDLGLREDRQSGVLERRSGGADKDRYRTANTTVSTSKTYTNTIDMDKTVFGFWTHDGVALDRLQHVHLVRQTAQDDLRHARVLRAGRRSTTDYEMDLYVPPPGEGENAFWIPNGAKGGRRQLPLVHDLARELLGGPRTARRHRRRPRSATSDWTSRRAFRSPPGFARPCSPS